MKFVWRLVVFGFLLTPGLLGAYMGGPAALMVGVLYSYMAAALIGILSAVHKKEGRRSSSRWLAFMGAFVNAVLGAIMLTAYFEALFGFSMNASATLGIIYGFVLLFMYEAARIWAWRGYRVDTEATA